MDEKEEKKKENDPYSLKRIYESMELELIDSFYRNLKRHAKEEKDLGFSWEMWQSATLRNLEKYRKEVLKITKSYSKEVEDAIKDAKINAKLNNLNNVEFYVGKAEEVVPKMYSEGKTANVVVVDPPRKGCDEKVLDTIVSMKPDRVVYVSCNPSTLARDLAYLDERGYKCVEIQPVDMFPHTMHVECCAKIVKKSDL